MCYPDDHTTVYISSVAQVEPGKALLPFDIGKAENPYPALYEN